MPIALSEAAQNTTDAVDLSIINELRTSDLMDRMIFDDAVNPAGGGATLTLEIPIGTRASLPMPVRAGDVVLQREASG